MIGDEDKSKQRDLSCHITSISWFPSSGSTPLDLFACTCSDGTLRFYKRGGIMEKKVKAHQGAAVIVEWNLDGTSAVTAGEDGEVKVS